MRALRFFHFVLLVLFFASGCAAPSGATAPSNTRATKGPPSPSTLGQLAQEEPSSALGVEADDARLGSPTAKVTIVAFLDYQCSFCAQGFATLLKLRATYSDEDLRVVFKHFPLESHELAIPAAIAGQAVLEGAGSEAFFQFSRLAFEHQAELSYAKLAEWAEEVGLSRDLYNELVGTELTVHRVAHDARLGHGVGVEATPVFYANGRLISGAQPLEYFRQVIGEELSAMNGKEGDLWKTAYQKRVNENMRGSLLESLLSQDGEDYLVPVDGSATRGPTDAPVTLVMFTDFECPFCKAAEVTIQLLRNEYGPSLRLVFKHLPLPFHHSARPAALLAEAVHLHKGEASFFAASDDIFHASPALERDALTRIGSAHGLSQRQIDDALDDLNPALRKRLEQDMDFSEDVLARGTPHFFINGKRLSGARPVEQFEALIDFGLRRAKELQKTGVTPVDIYAKLQEGALSPGVPERVTTKISEEGLPTRGAKDAAVTIHIFLDFECPYCREGEKVFEELERAYPGKLRYVWHDFPLEFHDRALPAARAGREAFAQKGNTGFWKMHGLLFGLGQEGVALGDEDILSHGKSLGMDLKRLGDALANPTHDRRIEAEMATAEAMGIRGTPAYVIGGYVVTGLKPVRYLKRLVDRSLKDAPTAGPVPASPAPRAPPE